MNRLTSATNPNITGLAASETYDYDATGNRLGLTYDAWNRINTALGKAYTYDADGNPNSVGGTALSHDNDGRMTQYGSNNYVYDPEWRRIQKTTASGTRYYVWDGELLMAEYDQAGNRIARYGYLPNDFSPTEVELNNITYHVRTDHLGTPLELVNAANNVVWRAHYESFGNAVIEDDVDGDGTHIEFNARLPGQYYDVETGLYYNWHRYYDPSTGRYISSDPIGLEGGLNTFAYAEGNPLSLYDPYGLWVWGDPIDQRIIDFSAGFGDTITSGFGLFDSSLTGMARDGMGTNGYVNQCSGAYTGGQYGAYAWGAVMFRGGVSPGGFLNSNRYFRMGYGYHHGKSVFRLAGSVVRKFKKNGHINLF